jgi:hypothetical protein
MGDQAVSVELDYEDAGDADDQDVDSVSAKAASQRAASSDPERHPAEEDIGDDFIPFPADVASNGHGSDDGEDGGSGGGGDLDVSKSNGAEVPAGGRRLLRRLLTVSWS